MEEKWIVETVKKSFLMAYEGYIAALRDRLKQNEEDVCNIKEMEKLAEDIGKRGHFTGLAVELSPIAAEVFRMLTQPVVVTVDAGVKISSGRLDELKHTVDKLGYRGIICAGGITFEFPTSEPIELNVEGIIEEEKGGGDKDE